ncbi:hypothetical protein CPSG_09647 [Coccidioides posadasii str. Silveira]|uniref:Uncharacterized protein n=1 Tax=Coccidioides posadasii (strain RMSCC 757 / Silveira) TaxID=443226 RepID=E9DIJ8_COCPS|nr:hypothetical protein CPSG_09647 [Coccidioides posadasii str. Silveira]
MKRHRVIRRHLCIHPLNHPNCSGEYSRHSNIVAEPIKPRGCCMESSLEFTVEPRPGRQIWLLPEIDFCILFPDSVFIPFFGHGVSWMIVAERIKRKNTSFHVIEKVIGNIDGDALQTTSQFIKENLRARSSYLSKPDDLLFQLAPYGSRFVDSSQMCHSLANIAGYETHLLCHCTEKLLYF